LCADSDAGSDARAQGPDRTMLKAIKVKAPNRNCVCIIR
jgi:hypothetical protein